ncbi:MAG TPA: type II secretion system F family protein [Lacipirellulaceae bacterium]|nr:type II secretion system F family protein [Lacipirellulaceae bacterium]
MARRKRLVAAGVAAASGDGPTLLGGARAAATGMSLPGWLRPRRAARRLKPSELTFVLRNLATLVGNGVPLPRALATLAQEDSLARHRDLINGIRRKVETGAPFSTAMQDVPGVCDRLTASQIRIGERSGTLADTLAHLAQHRDKSSELRSQIIKKIAYPAMLMVLGSALIAFLLVYVVPVFEQTYAEAHVALPLVTQILIAVGGVAKKYALPALGVAAVGLVALVQLRKNDVVAARMDGALLKTPLMGRWLRDIAVLQLMDALSTLMAAGFTLAEALRQTAESVDNRAVRRGVRALVSAVERGERFSREIERLSDLFPPVVNQLVVVGESTGQLGRATADICEHLRREIERKTSLMVGALEPILTISLASAIAVILLAIYLPMFDMVNAVAK